MRKVSDLVMSALNAFMRHEPNRVFLIQHSRGYGKMGRRQTKADDADGGKSFPLLEGRVISYPTPFIYLGESCEGTCVPFGAFLPGGSPCGEGAGGTLEYLERYVMGMGRMAEWGGWSNGADGRMGRMA